MDEQRSSNRSMKRLLGWGFGALLVVQVSACFGGGETAVEEPDAPEDEVNQEKGGDPPGQPPGQGSNNQGGDQANANNGEEDVVEEEDDLDEIELASEGEALMPVIIGEAASVDTVKGADDLMDYLGQITGADFDVQIGDGSSGIVVGTLDDFDELPFDDISFGDGTFEREDYLLRSTEEGLYILGSTPLAVQFGVWDALYEMGHRQFFPTDTWEVIPDEAELKVAVDRLESPDYYNRQGPRGAMRMDQRPWAQQPWERWQLRNRITPVFELATGHVYDSVINNNQSAFDANPEYWGLLDGQRSTHAQPNVAHPDVQQMFIDYAMNRFGNNPSLDSVAMDPRDGNRWSESSASQAIGTGSDQAVHMANLVAQEVVDEFGEDKYVGMYGYANHSPPPNLEVHPNVIVSLATDYIRGGYTFEEMIDGWSPKTNMMGIREYYGLYVWDASLPGDGAKAANTAYLAETIPHFYNRGARFMNAESNDTWGGYGLGYYLATRMMWDVSEADRIDELIEDFVEKAFGPAEESMAGFYALIDGSSADPYNPASPRPLNDDMVGRMYRYLDDARQSAQGDEEVMARLDDLVLYTHYVELYRRFDAIEGSARQEAFDELVNFAWRIRETMMTESNELVRELNRDVRADSNLSWGPGRTVNQPADNQRVNEDVPFTDAQIEAMVSDGIANHELLDFDMEPWIDEADLVVADLDPDERGGTPSNRISRGSVHAIIDTDDGTLPELTISAGHIYDDRGPVRWEVQDIDGNTVDEGAAPGDEADHVFDLQAPGPGKYKLRITNTGQGFIWDHDPRGSRVTMPAGGKYELGRNWYDLLYFYVPEGIEDIYLKGTMMEGRHDFVDGSGQAVDSGDIEVIQGYTRVPVPAGEDGEVWSLELTAWRPGIQFLNVPGYVAFSPEELLLPEDVVIAEIE